MTSFYLHFAISFVAGYGGLVYGWPFLLGFIFIHALSFTIWSKRNPDFVQTNKKDHMAITFSIVFTPFIAALMWFFFFLSQIE